MKCLRLSHVNLRVERLPDAVRFYRDVLGLESIDRRDDRGRGAWFRLGDAEVHLSEDPAPQPPSRRHVAVVVDDLQGALDEVQAAGAEIEPGDATRFWARDPSGNRLEFIQGPR